MSLSISGSSGFLQAQQAMFAKLDLNTDGSLSEDEFSALPKTGMGQELPAQGGARQLRGGGGFHGFSPETLGALLSVQQMSHADRAAEIFSNADSDGDGSLTAEELSADMAAHASPGPEVTDTATRASDLITAGDTDGDGALSAEEFTALKPSGPPPGGPPPSQASGETEEETTYDAADSNKDGTVSMSELLASLQSTREATSGFDTEVSDLMAKLLEKLQAAVAASAETAEEATA